MPRQNMLATSTDPWRRHPRNRAPNAKETANAVSPHSARGLIRKSSPMTPRTAGMSAHAAQ